MCGRNVQIYKRCGSDVCIREASKLDSHLYRSSLSTSRRIKYFCICIKCTASNIYATGRCSSGSPCAFREAQAISWVAAWSQAIRWNSILAILFCNYFVYTAFLTRISIFCYFRILTEKASVILIRFFGNKGLYKERIFIEFYRIIFKHLQS